MTKYFQSANGLWMPNYTEPLPKMVWTETPWRESSNSLLHVKYAIAALSMCDPLPKYPIYKHYEEDKNWLRQQRYKNGWNRMWKRQMIKNVRRALEKQLRKHKEYQELLRVCADYEKRRQHD